MIPYGPWRPDAGGPGSGFAQTAEGVVPQSASTGLGYGPFPKLAVADGATSLSGDPRGGLSFQLDDGSYEVVFATETTIEMLNSSYGWDVIESGRSIQPSDDVSFARFGSYLINTDLQSGMKAYNVEVPAGNNAISGAPVARYVFATNDVLVALDCDGNNRRLESTDIGRYDKWTGGAADGKTFEDGGALIAGMDLKNGSALVLQERCVRLLQFGGPATYTLAKVADGRGCVGARTAVGFDGRAFWWDVDGPWMYDGALTPIGAEKINRWALLNIGADNYGNLQGVVDPSRNLVLWRVDNTRSLAFNWLLGEWSVLPMSANALSRLATPAVNIDSVSDLIDDVSTLIDSSVWGGSAPQLGALDINNRFATFTGGNMATVLECSQQANPVTGLVSWATPIDDANGGTLQVGVSDRLDTALTYKAGVAKTASGRVPLRARGKNIGFKRNIPADTAWTYANGVDNVVAAGGGPK